MNIVIEHSDCFSFMKSIKDKSIHLAVCDPPYNYNKGGWDKFSTHSDFMDFTHRWLDVVIDKLTDDGSLYVFNTQRNSAYILVYLESKGLIFKSWITWHKPYGLGKTKKKWCGLSETITYYTIGEKWTFNYNNVRVPYQLKTRTKYTTDYGGSWSPDARGSMCTDLWNFKQDYKRKDHPTAKPIYCIKRIIAASSNIGDTILDPFLGSGTTALACADLNRNFMGCDSDKRYVDLSKKRLEDFLSQPKLNFG